jgi:hypothetical protein
VGCVLGEGDVADIVQAVVDGSVSAQRGGDLFRIGAFGGAAGQAEYCDGGGGVVVQVGNVAFDEEVLRGVGKSDRVRGGQDLDGASFGAAVTAVVLGVGDRDLCPG